MASDLFLIIIWWSWILLLGLIFLPVTSKLFHSFFDKGYLFAKTAGIITVSFISWLLSSLLILPFRRSVIFGIIIAIALIIYVGFKNYKLLKELIINNKKVFIAEEIMFFLGIAAWAYIRGINPDILGLEKYMDFGFVNSILRADYMPAKDMWFAGENINYYYFGHFICAFLTKLSAIDSAVTYNLMLCTIFSFMFTLTFSLAANLTHFVDKNNYKKIIAAGLISAALLALGGNLHGFIYGVIVPKAQAAGLCKVQANAYYYPDSTRYIGYNPSTNDKTIHEFPIYSLVVSDLHGHVSNVPFVLTFLGLVLCYLTNRGNSKLDKYCGLFAVFLLGTFYMTNSWDYPIYLVVAGLAMLYKKFFIENMGVKAIISAVLTGIVMIILSQIIDLPFTLNFVNMAGGVGFVRAHTPLYQILVLWGYQLLFAVVFLIFSIFWSKKNAAESEEAKSNSKFKNRMLALFSSDIFTLILFICAIGLLIVPEIIYIKDIYGVTYQRANTMFKFTYQSFIMFAIVIGYSLVRIISGINRKALKLILAIVLIIDISLPMVYPFFAIKGYYGNIRPSNYKGLYGLKFLEDKHREDYYVVKWLNNNIKGQEVVLEASGDDFTSYNRISMATGLPTIVGWSGHEWLWRGSDDPVKIRTEAEKVIYESSDVNKTLENLKYYNVSYIIIGSFEKEKYHDIKIDKLMSLGEVVVNLPNTKLIKLK